MVNKVPEFHIGLLEEIIYFMYGYFVCMHMHIP